jgi:gamma-glutamyltranspeptidase/glutathione hydrolase
MAVSYTYTLENSYGNRVVVRGAGYLLNNQMTDFNPKPGHTTRGGQIGTKANLIEPGKRMLSSMSPVIVERDCKVVLVTGSPGGRTIINTVLCIVLNVIDFDVPVDEAVAAPRLHHQWFPDVVRIEGVKQRVELVAKLKAMDYKVTDEARQGDGHSIAIDPKTGLRIGAADKRIDGKAVGE